MLRDLFCQLVIDPIREQAVKANDRSWEIGDLCWNDGLRVERFPKMVPISAVTNKMRVRIEMFF